MTRTLTGVLCRICVCILIASCGGGSPGTSSYIDRSGVYIGDITGFGSVIVGGVHFDTQAATIEVDDRQSDESALRVGQYVRIDGSLNADGTTGVADFIVTDPALKGSVDSVDLVAGTLTVLDTTIIVDIDTLFGPTVSPPTLTSISTGDRLEIQGTRDADGAVLASRIDRVSDTELEVRGQISGLDTTAQRFQIQGLTVAYADAQLVGFNSASPANGQTVEAEGAQIQSGVLQAARLELEIDSRFEAEEEGTEVELSGIVTRFAGADDFEVGGVQITTDGSTRYENGASASLAAGVSLSLEGTVTSSGIVLAQSIELRQTSDFEATGRVESVTLASNSLVVLGTAVTVSSTTQFIDESETELRRFSLADVATGDYVEVRGTANQNGVAANLLKRSEPEDEIEISGDVTGIDEPDIELLGTRIQTTTETTFETDDEEVTRAVFFDALNIGDFIDAEGRSPSPGVLVAEKIERAGS